MKAAVFSSIAIFNYCAAEPLASLGIPGAPITDVTSGEILARSWQSWNKINEAPNNGIRNPSGSKNLTTSPCFIINFVLIILC